MNGEDLIFKQDLNKLNLNDENELNHRFSKIKRTKMMKMNQNQRLSKIKAFFTTISIVQCILYHRSGLLTLTSWLAESCLLKILTVDVRTIAPFLNILTRLSKFDSLIDHLKF